jgi:site-specific DNA-cytosine methylase
VCDELADPVAANQARTYTREGTHNFRLSNVTLDDGASRHGNAEETGPVEVLRTVREQIGEAAFIGWVARILVAFWPEEILQSALHGCGLRLATWSRDWLVHCALALAQSRAEGAMQSVREAISERCASQGWQPSEQRARELGAYLSKLSQPGASAEAVLFTVRSTGEGTRLLQSALSALEKMGRPNHRQNTGLRVRRLTAVECEFLQGFPRNYTLVPYRGRLAKDGPRYKAIGNSMAVPCMAWLGSRMAHVDAL